MKTLIYDELCKELGIDPVPGILPPERIARLFDVPVELVTAGAPEVVSVRLMDDAENPLTEHAPRVVVTPERYGRWLHADEIPTRARRPWVAVEQLDATQQIPIVQDGTA